MGIFTITATATIFGIVSINLMQTAHAQAQIENREIVNIGGEQFLLITYDDGSESYTSLLTGACDYFYRDPVSNAEIPCSCLSSSDGIKPANDCFSQH